MLIVRHYEAAVEYYHYAAYLMKMFMMESSIKNKTQVCAQYD